MTKEEWKEYRATHAYQISVSQHKKYEKNKEKIKAKNKEYARQKRLRLGMKPRGERKKACDSCIHFIHREVGIKGGIRGVCELLENDIYFYKAHGKKRWCRPICKKFEEITSGRE